MTIGTTWRLGSLLGYTETPDWPLLYGYLIEVGGEPNVHQKLNFSFDDPGDIDIGVTTAMPIVNASAAACAAPPGTVSSLQLPLVTGRHHPLAQP